MRTFRDGTPLLSVGDRAVINDSWRLSRRRHRNDLGSGDQVYVSGKGTLPDTILVMDRFGKEHMIHQSYLNRFVGQFG